jgi:hypothetical protein
MCSHQIQEACKTVVGYDTAAVYVSTMMKNMPCGKEKVVDYEDPFQAARSLEKRYSKQETAQFREVQIGTRFEQMSPLYLKRLYPRQ